MLANEGRGGLFDPSLFGNDLSLGRVDSGLQVFRVEFGQHLFGRNPVTDIDHTLDDLAAHAERQFGLYSRLDVAGECHRGGVIRWFDLLHEDSWAVLLDGLFLSPQAVSKAMRLRPTINFNPGPAMQTPLRCTNVPVTIRLRA